MKGHTTSPRRRWHPSSSHLSSVPCSPAFTEEGIQTIDELYPDPATDLSSLYINTRDIPVGPQYRRVEAVHGNHAYACPVRQTATLASAGQEAPVFLHRRALKRQSEAGRIRPTRCRTKNSALMHVRYHKPGRNFRSASCVFLLVYCHGGS